MHLKLIPHPWLSMVLLVMWLALNNTAALAHVLLGSVLAIAIPILTQSFWVGLIPLHHPKLALRFFGVMLYDIVIANFQVAKLIIGKVEHLRPCFFEVPLRAKHPSAITLLANCITLTPGTVSCVISDNRTSITVHGLSVDDVADTIATIQTRYEMPIMQLFHDAGLHAATGSANDPLHSPEEVV
jgi:multicomponent K+:H+ antiporter subunit E